MAYAGKRFQRDGCPQSAAALTYMSLFAVVPMLTLMYSMFSLVPAFQELGSQVEGFIFSKFLPSSGQEITRYLADFFDPGAQVEWCRGADYFAYPLF